MCILLGNPANDRRSSCTTSKETTTPTSGSYSKTLFCFVCDGNSVPKGHLLWSTDVRKFPSLFPFPDLTNFLESLSSLCCFLLLLELLYLFRCMCKWVVTIKKLSIFLVVRDFLLILILNSLHKQVSLLVILVRWHKLVLWLDNRAKWEIKKRQLRLLTLLQGPWSQFLNVVQF